MLYKYRETVYFNTPESQSIAWGNKTEEISSVYRWSLNVLSSLITDIFR